MDIIDTEIWIGIFVLTAILYSIKFLQSRRKTRVYRISPESLQRSKQVILDVLPLVEDGYDTTMDETRLPYPKDNIKSAAKILAYYFYRENQMKELERVQHCFIALSRFQNRDLDPEMREKRAESEKKRLTQELQSYMSNSPFKAGKAA